ncbi:MAG: hypothetical protein VKJ04_08785 [Vampirovibrionales bacterium]|nr:hypothetical protein [Vampirovibrionales bacterium]
MTSDFFKHVVANTPDTLPDGVLMSETASEPNRTVSSGRSISPVTQTVQQAITRRQHLVCSLPLQAHSPALYALPALMSQGMAVVLCPDHETILRQMDFFAQNGFAYPEVCYLDQEQMPHDWRDVVQQIDHHRVKLLYTTPETFDTLNFIDLMVHAPISFIGVEQADYLYKPIQRGFHYDRFKEALARFRKKPPLLLFFPVLPDSLLVSLLQQLDLKQVESLQHLPETQSFQLRCHRLASPYHKQKRLIELLLQPAELSMPLSSQALLGRIYSPDSAMVRIADLPSAQILQRALTQYGFDAVHIWHPDLTQPQKRHLERIFCSEPHQIVLVVGEGHRYLKGTKGSHLKLIDWQLPLALEESIAAWLRAASHQDHPYEHTITAHLLYSSDDLSQLARRAGLNASGKQARGSENALAAKRLYQWLGAMGCRKQNLLYAWDLNASAKVLPCGLCDRCQLSQNVCYRMFKPLYPLWEKLRL